MVFRRRCGPNFWNSLGIRMRLIDSGVAISGNEPCHIKANGNCLRFCPWLCPPLLVARFRIASLNPYYLKPTLKMGDEVDTLSFELNQSISHRKEPKLHDAAIHLRSTEFLVAEA